MSHNLCPYISPCIILVPTTDSGRVICSTQVPLKCSISALRILCSMIHHFIVSHDGQERVYETCRLCCTFVLCLSLHNCKTHCMMLSMLSNTLLQPYFINDLAFHVTLLYNYNNPRMAIFDPERQVRVDGKRVFITG